MRQIEELVSLEKQMEFSRIKSFPLISQTRFLVKEGELDEISGFESGHTIGSPTRSVYLHLFNDLLLLSRKDNGRFSVLDYARIWKVRARCFEAKSLVFALCLVENHKGTNRNFIVGAGNEYEIQEWVAAISTLQRSGTEPPSIRNAEHWTATT
ncbi:ephexin-1-like [Hemiscyllium ocellatum]|uniref:ephexin-1-like n=1 Tax=Hemiscyllium ocellatum TaxID=170820 RepID=UPI0029660909|nr:ephexin-1-like [Hemiscyllium ocellatum]